MSSSAESRPTTSVVTPTELRVRNRHNAPADRVDVRRHNLSLVVRLLSSPGPRSRAGISAATGLTRATVSSLATELIGLGLVREVGLDSGGGRGRPGTLLELDGSAVVTVGVELNLGSITVCIRDLGGRIVAERRIAHSTADSGSPREAIALLASVIGETVTELARDGRRLSGLTVAVPGVVDIQRGTVRFAPNLDWRDIYLLDELRTVVGPDVALWLDNEANLGALAEYRAGALAGTGNLVYLLIENGVGGGMIVNGALHRGASGAAGEVGHMTVKTVDGARCACGRRGCLETVAGLAALLELTVPAMAGEVLHDHTLNDENRTGAIAAAASRGDTAVLAGLHEWARWVGIGVANIIDLLDPDAVVLAGHPCSLAAWILPTVIEVAGANAMPGAMDTCEIVTSTLGFSAAALGGAIHAAERILADPKLIVTG